MTLQIPWLNARSHFSMGESLAEPGQLIEAAQKAGLASVMLADTMTVSGMPEFFTAAKKAGIKPMLSVRLRLVDELVHDKAEAKKHRPWFLRAIVLNEAGWSSMLRLLSLAFDEDHFYAVPRLTLADVVSGAGGGGIALTLGDAYGAAGAGRAAAVVAACRGAAIPLYAEATLAPTPLGVRLAREALLLQDEGVPTLLAPQALYADAGQADSLDLMASIARNMPFDTLSPRRFTRDHVVGDLTSIVSKAGQIAKQLTARYGEPAGPTWLERIKSAIQSSRQIETFCTFQWDKMPASLPKLAADENAELVERVKQGFKTRFSREVFGYKPSAAEVPRYLAQANHEIEVISKLGFSPYFLLVADVVSWAKQQGIQVGPGRGSVGGSLVAYLIGITDVDPLRFGLLFERFINPERIDLPDADLDFASLRREEVIEHLKIRFGDDYVAGVANYNTMQAAGALKDVCRMLSVPVTGTAFSKLVPKEHGQSYSIDEALEEVPDLAKFAEANPEVIRHAKNLEGRIRAYGKHAAGMIVAGVKLDERAVVERRKGDRIINWDKRLAEDFGLVKLDVLGLSTLDMLDIAAAEIKARHGTQIDLLRIPLDDDKVLEAFGRGETVAVFQFESHGMRRLLRSLAQGGKLSFSDLAIATALYRPGPMDSGLMDDFVKIRQGIASPRYDHPSMQAALQETSGVMVYQEQVMQVARDFAGFTMPESDHLRKAMGKKDKAKMAEWADRFADGAVATHGVDRRLAQEIFAKIEKFASYGFNKSHAVEYALISYQTMWLKQYYPVEFWAGVMTMLKEERRDLALADMGRMGIKLLPPDANNSLDRFTALNDTVLLAPFSSVKGVSERCAKAIMEARAEKGPFASLKDFEGRVPARMCNATQRANLQKVGAFARIEGEVPADDPSRRVDQVELMPGLISDAVIIDREIDLSPPNVQTLIGLIEGWKACERCDLKGLCHPKPMVLASSRAMVVVDAPNFREEAKDEMGYGSSFDAIAAALEEAGMAQDEIYLTALVKSPKPKAGWNMKTLAECPMWLEEEIRILKPPVVVILGTEAFKHFFKGVKGGLNEHTGRVVYDNKRGLNFLVGMNPNAIHFSPEKQDTLNEVMRKLPELLPFR